MCKLAGAILKFYKRRSKITVMVTFKIYGTIGKEWGIRHTYAKYERPISYSTKVFANVQKKVKGHGQGLKFKHYGTVGKALS